MENIKRWDAVWKELCNPNKIWGRTTIIKLLGEEFADCDVEFHDADTEAFNLYSGQTTYMDKLLIATANFAEKKIHLEFQSTFDPHCGLRFLKYDLGTVDSSVINSGVEHIHFPATRIIDVRDNLRYSTEGYPIVLHFNGKRCTLRYPVVKVLDAFAGLRQIISATTDEKCSEGFGLFLREFPDIKASTDAMKELGMLCSYLRHPALYISGVADNDEEVKRMADKFVRTGKNFEQLAREEEREIVLEEHIQALMRRLGITRDVAMDYLGVKKVGVSGLSSMKLS